MTNEPIEVINLSYEDARGELERIVQRLESGEAPLAESMKLWERADALGKHCQDILNAATARLDAANQQAESPQQGSH